MLNTDRFIVNSVMQAPSEPLVMDEKTKTFYALFDHVTPGQQGQYGGQAVQPDADVEFENLPSETPQNDLPEAPKVAHRNFLAEDQQNIERAHKEEKVSERYQKARTAYVNIFG